VTLTYTATLLFQTFVHMVQYITRIIKDTLIHFGFRLKNENEWPMIYLTL